MATWGAGEAWHVGEIRWTEHAAVRMRERGIPLYLVMLTAARPRAVAHLPVANRYRLVAEHEGRRLVVICDRIGALAMVRTAFWTRRGRYDAPAEA